jgi:dihydroorotate dehydrogenase (NAD+) catalytic subunit
VKKKRPALARGTGGLSGPAVRPVGVACTYRASRAVSIPVIGLGGIMCAEDAIQYLLAGARAIQVGTANFVSPRAPLEVLAGIGAWMEAEGVARIEDIPALLRC